MKFQRTSDGFVRFVAIIICSVWALWILITCAIVIVDIFCEKPTILDKNIRYIIFFVALYSLAAFFLMMQPKCKACGKKIFNEKAQLRKKTWLSGWPEVVLSIVKKNEFVCMHCGKAVVLKKGK